MSKPSRLVLPPSDKLTEALLTEGGARLMFSNDDVCVLESADCTFLEKARRGGRKWTRIFEEYYLATAGDDRAQGVMVSAFFDWLADRYNTEIEIKRNIACYEKLYDFATQLRRDLPTSAVLDLGCGPGTILHSSVARVAQVLVGYDISDVAAKTAVSAGLKVLSKDEFLRGSASFDVALSAYTMHYACDFSETMAGVQCSLRPGGVWALNFHKGIGLDAFFSRLEGCALEFTGQVTDSSFGPIVAVTMART